MPLSHNRTDPTTARPSRNLVTQKSGRSPLCRSGARGHVGCASIWVPMLKVPARYSAHDDVALHPVTLASRRQDWPVAAIGVRSYAFLGVSVVTRT